MSLLPQPLQSPWDQPPLEHLFLPSGSCPWALLPPPFLLPMHYPTFSPCRYSPCPEGQSSGASSWKPSLTLFS